MAEFAQYPPIVRPGQEYSVQNRIDTLQTDNGIIRQYGLPRNEISDKYLVRILSSKLNNSYDYVIAYLSEDFVEELNSNWGNMINISTDTINTVFQTLLGISTQNLLMYRQIWEGNDPYRGKLLLTFVAETNSKENVEKPIRILQKMAAPSQGTAIDFGGGFNIPSLIPPVPSAMTPSNGITISIGESFDLVGCVFTQVSVVRKPIFDTTYGNSIHADVTISFQLVNPTTKEDYDRFIEDVG